MAAAGNRNVRFTVFSFLRIVFPVYPKRFFYEVNRRDTHTFIEQVLTNDSAIESATVCFMAVLSFACVLGSDGFDGYKFFLPHNYDRAQWATRCSFGR